MVFGREIRRRPAVRMNKKARRVCRAFPLDASLSRAARGRRVWEFPKGTCALFRVFVAPNALFIPRSRIVKVWHCNATNCKRGRTIPIGIQIGCEPMVASEEERNALEGSNWIAFPLVKVLDHSGTCARARWARHTVFARRASPYRLVNTIYVVTPRVWTKETSTRRWTRAQTHGETGRRIPNRHRPFRLPA